VHEDFHAMAAALRHAAADPITDWRLIGLMIATAADLDAAAEADQAEIFLPDWEASWCPK
jgi:hypothetical protein